MDAAVLSNLAKGLFGNLRQFAYKLLGNLEASLGFSPVLGVPYQAMSLYFCLVFLLYIEKIGQLVDR